MGIFTCYQRKQSRLNGGDRFARPGYISWLTETANSFINHSAKPVDPSLTQWGNALNNRSAQLLWQDYQNGVTTYASYVSISGYEVDLVLQVSVIGSVFVVQNDVQWHKTGTLQNWFYPEE
ncbi:MAG: hypothetical protein M5U34_35380 [Chloroflexi bacterium]|nr:hypothetical protein [Chloroflexota bacterium]